MNRTGSHRRPGREGARSRALPDRLRRAPQGARRRSTVEAGPDPGRVGSVHVLDPHRGCGHGEVQGPRHRRHVSTRKWTRSPGLSRKIVVDSPDEKKQPLIEIRDKAGKVDAEVPHAVARPPHGRGRRGGVTPARCSRRFRARPRRRRTSRAVCRAWSSCSRRGSRARRRSSRRSTASSGTAASSRGSARSSSSRRTVASRESTRCRAACTSTSRKATASARASRSWTGRAIRTTSCRSSARRRCTRISSTRSRRSTGCRASTSTTSTSRSSSGR